MGGYFFGDVEVGQYVLTYILLLFQSGFAGE